MLVGVGEVSLGIYFITAYLDYESGRYSPKLFKSMDVAEVRKCGMSVNDNNLSVAAFRCAQLLACIYTNFYTYACA